MTLLPLNDLWPCPACGRIPSARLLPNSEIFRGRQTWVVRCFNQFSVIQVEGGEKVAEPGYGHDFYIEAETKEKAEQEWDRVFGKKIGGGKEIK